MGRQVAFREDGLDFLGHGEVGEHFELRVGEVLGELVGPLRHLDPLLSLHVLLHKLDRRFVLVLQEV